MLNQHIKKDGTFDSHRTNLLDDENMLVSGNDMEITGLDQLDKRF